MIVIIEDEAFVAGGLALSTIVHLGFEGQHRVQADPPYDSQADQAVNRWLETLDPITREEAEFAFEAGMERDALGFPSDLTVRIADVPRPEWDSSPLRIPLSLAPGFLRKPLRLVPENRHNDGAFLKTVPPSPWRKELQKCLQREWIEIGHGGGSDMRKSHFETASREEALRLWALFDSDSREPGRPSKAQEALRQCCMRKNIPHHQLQRRAIENYLPIQALEAWVALSPGNVRKARRSRVEALAAMRPEQRHHYNMKKGFAGDRKHPEGITDLFSDIAGNRHLQNGFGEDIAALFHQEEFEIREEWLARDGQHPETLAMVQSILRRL